MPFNSIQTINILFYNHQRFEFGNSGVHPVPNNNIFDWTKFKALAGEQVNATEI